MPIEFFDLGEAAPRWHHIFLELNRIPEFDCCPLIVVRRKQLRAVLVIALGAVR
jgi:hypothetical protein